jgi:hypothetical protein
MTKGLGGALAVAVVAAGLAAGSGLAMAPAPGGPARANRTACGCRRGTLHGQWLPTSKADFLPPHECPDGRDLFLGSDASPLRRAGIPSPVFDIVPRQERAANGAPFQ